MFNACFECIECKKNVCDLSEDIYFNKKKVLFLFYFEKKWEPVISCLPWPNKRDKYFERIGSLGGQFNYSCKYSSLSGMSHLYLEVLIPESEDSWEFSHLDYLAGNLKIFAPIYTYKWIVTLSYRC